MSKSATDGLKNLMKAHGLTYGDVAQLACVSKKTVESWLASPDSAMHRNFHPRHLGGIMHNLPALLKARKKAKKA